MSVPGKQIGGHDHVDRDHPCVQWCVHLARLNSLSPVRRQGFEPRTR